MHLPLHAAASRAGSALILVCIVLTVALFAIIFTFLRTAINQGEASRALQRSHYTLQAARDGVNHAVWTITKDYVDAPGTPTHLRAPYRRTFDPIDTTYQQVKRRSSLNASDTGVDDVSSFDLVTRGAVQGMRDNVNKDQEQVYARTGVLSHPGTARYFAQGRFNHDLADLADPATAGPRFSDTAGTADVDAPAYYDEQWRPCSAAQARYRMRYAVAVEDLAGHYLLPRQVAHDAAGTYAQKTEFDETWLRNGLHFSFYNLCELLGFRNNQALWSTENTTDDALPKQGFASTLSGDRIAKLYNAKASSSTPGGLVTVSASSGLQLSEHFNCNAGGFHHWQSLFWGLGLSYRGKHFRGFDAGGYPTVFDYDDGTRAMFLMPVADPPAWMSLNMQAVLEERTNGDIPGAEPAGMARPPVGGVGNVRTGNDSIKWFTPRSGGQVPLAHATPGPVYAFAQLAPFGNQTGNANRNYGSITLSGTNPAPETSDQRRTVRLRYPGARQSDSSGYGAGVMAKPNGADAKDPLSLVNDDSRVWAECAFTPFGSDRLMLGEKATGEAQVSNPWQINPLTAPPAILRAQITGILRREQYHLLLDTEARIKASPPPDLGTSTADTAAPVRWTIPANRQPSYPYYDFCDLFTARLRHQGGAGPFEKFLPRYNYNFSVGTGLKVHLPPPALAKPPAEVDANRRHWPYPGVDFFVQDVVDGAGSAVHSEIDQRSWRRPDSQVVGGGATLTAPPYDVPFEVQDILGKDLDVFRNGTGQYVPMLLEPGLPRLSGSDSSGGCLLPYYHAGLNIRIRNDSVIDNRMGAYSPPVAASGIDDTAAASATCVNNGWGWFRGAGDFFANDPRLNRESIWWDLQMALAHTVVLTRATWRSTYEPAAMRVALPAGLTLIDDAQEMDAVFLRYLGIQPTPLGTDPNNGNFVAQPIDRDASATAISYTSPDQDSAGRSNYAYIALGALAASPFTKDGTGDFTRLGENGASGATTELKELRQRRSVLLELVINDIRMSFFGATRGYPGGWQALDLNQDGVAVSSATHLIDPDKRTPRSLAASDPESGNGWATARAAGLPFSLTGYWQFGKSHYYRIWSRGEIFDVLKNAKIDEQTIEAVYCVDPDGTRSAASMSKSHLMYLGPSVPGRQPWIAQPW